MNIEEIMFVFGVKMFVSNIMNTIPFQGRKYVQKQVEPYYAFASPMNVDIFQHSPQAPFPLASNANLIPRQSVTLLTHKTRLTIPEMQTNREMDQLAKRYYATLEKQIKDPKDIKESKKKNFLKLYRHELVNAIATRLQYNTDTDLREAFFPNLNNAEYLKIQKKGLIDVLDRTDAVTDLWASLEDWHNNPEKKVPFSDLRRVLQTAISHTREDGQVINVTNPEIMGGKIIRHPYEGYQKISQVLLNAVKYSEGKPFEINYECRIGGASPQYFMNVINHGTHAIPNHEIDKILSGSGHRAEHTRDSIRGTGTGVPEVLEIIKKQGLHEHIPNLIEKGRVDGVKFSIPLCIDN